MKYCEYAVVAEMVNDVTPTIQGLLPLASQMVNAVIRNVMPTIRIADRYENFGIL
jgi:hypothetical protein